MRARARVCTQSPRPHPRFSAHHNPLTTLRPVQWGTHEVCGCDPLCHHLVNVQPWHAHMQDANQSRDRCAALMHMLMPSSVRSLAASMRDKVLCTINTDVGGLWHRRRVSNALHARRTACAVSIQLAYSLADSLPLSLLFDVPRHAFARIRTQRPRPRPRLRYPYLSHPQGLTTLSPSRSLFTTTPHPHGTQDNDETRDTMGSCTVQWGTCEVRGCHHPFTSH